MVSKATLQDLQCAVPVMSQKYFLLHTLLPRSKKNLPLQDKRHIKRSSKIDKSIANVPNIHYKSNAFQIMKNTHCLNIDKDCKVKIFFTVKNEGKTFILTDIFMGTKKYVTLKFKLK